MDTDTYGNSSWHDHHRHLSMTALPKPQKFVMGSGPSVPSGAKKIASMRPTKMTSMLSYAVK